MTDRVPPSRRLTPEEISGKDICKGGASGKSRGREEKEILQAMCVSVRVCEFVCVCVSSNGLLCVYSIGRCIILELLV